MSPPFLRDPIDPARVRVIDGSFAFVPHAFLRRGFFASLSHDERGLYFFLLLVGDRRGVSFYHYDSICSALIAFDGQRFQVLSLPERPRLRPSPPLRTRDELELHDPATIQRLVDEIPR